MTENKAARFSQTIWTEYEPPLEKPLFWQIGSLRVWCIREGQELRLAWSRSVSETASMQNPEQAPEDLTWQRWAFRQKNPKIRLAPAFPDRPVVVKPESPLRIAEDATTRIYVRIPIWLQVILVSKPPAVLLDIPVVTMSKTWFGTFMDGELCYWLSSGARRQVKPDSDRPFLTVCPIQLIDKSPEDLNVEKICLRVGGLSLFHDGQQLWSDDTRIIYKGLSEVSQVDVGGVAPDESRSAKLMAAPREPLKKSIPAKTFASLKDLPGLGLFTR